MSRVFWMAVGAVGGVAAYRRGTRAAERAKELGPLGSAQVAAQATSRLAGRTAHGLGRLADLKAQRDGRLVIGTVEEVATEQTEPIPTGWVPAPSSVPPTPTPTAAPPPGSAPSSPPPPPPLRGPAGATPRTRPRRGARSTTRDGT